MGPVPADGRPDHTGAKPATRLASVPSSPYIATMRWRSPLAGLAIIVGLAVYAIVMVSLADFVPDHTGVQSIYYLAAGVLWIWPAVAVIGWAKKDDAAGEG